MQIVISLLIIFALYSAIAASISASNLPNCTVPPALSYLTPCRCDIDCTFYGDCCHLKRQWPPPPSVTSCVPVSTTWSLWLIDRCPAEWSVSMVRNLCERKVTPEEKRRRFDLAVEVSAGFRLYKNVYCAMCHDAEINKPKLRLDCPQKLKNTSKVVNSTVAEHAIDNENCRLVSELNLTPFRKCQAMMKLVNDCKTTQLPKNDSRLFNNSLSWEEVVDKCRTGETHWISCNQRPNIAYRNQYCAECNLNTRCTEESYLTADRGIKLGSKSFSPYQYHVLLDLRDLTRNVLQLDDTSDRNTNISTNATNQSNNTNSNTLEDTIAGALGIAGSILSLLALIILLVVYVTLPSLRNLAGLLVTSLALSILVGLICFLVGPLFSSWVSACRAVAGVMYFAYVSSFAWMCVFAIDLLRTLTSDGGPIATPTMGPRLWRRYARFAVIGWLLPLAMTVTVLVVDVTMDTDWPGRPRLGDGQLCWFNNTIGLLVWFYCPVALAIGINCIVTMLLFVSLRRTAAQTRRVQRRGGRGASMALLSLKVTSIFGLTWVLGLVAAWIDVWSLKMVAGL